MLRGHVRAMTEHCLLVIDLLNDFLDSWPADEVASIVSSTNTLTRAFREQRLPVIWVRQEFLPDLSDAFLEMRDRNVKICIAGTRGAELHPDLEVRSGDHMIVKKRYSAFFRTGLDPLLEALGVRRVTIGGINTHACIRMAAIDAYQRDLRVILAKECIGSYAAEHAKVSLDYMDGKIATVKALTDIIADIGPSGARTDPLETKSPRSERPHSVFGRLGS